MKKQYVNPTMEVVNLKMQGCLMAGSNGGVATGGAPGNEYTATDVSYGREEDDWDE